MGKISAEPLTAIIQCHVDAPDCHTNPMASSSFFRSNKQRREVAEVAYKINVWGCAEILPIRL